MTATPDPIFETERLRIRSARPEDAPLFHALWTDPRVMTNVGFPKGLDVTVPGIEADIRERSESVFDRFLVVERKEDGVALGECKLHPPDEEGIAGTDVKLRPEHHGHRYGTETKQGLVDWLFTHTDCTHVEGGPNVANVASIRMQEAVGGVRVDERTWEFPEGMKVETVPVHHYVYRVSRETWAKRRASAD
jgi:RimJ/RimL family protein N-acetyltransferase